MSILEDLDPQYAALKNQSKNRNRIMPILGIAFGLSAIGVGIAYIAFTVSNNTPGPDRVRPPLIANAPAPTKEPGQTTHSDAPANVSVQPAPAHINDKPELASAADPLPAPKEPPQKTDQDIKTTALDAKTAEAAEPVRAVSKPRPATQTSAKSTAGRDASKPTTKTATAPSEGEHKKAAERDVDIISAIVREGR